MIIIIDNYDSFVYNVARYVEELGFAVCVYRNDKISIAQIAELPITHMILSPGPCSPNEAGITLSLIEKFAGRIPILGICLGHQAIGQAFGCTVERALHPMHGKASVITHNGENIFAGLQNPLKVGRYHSLIVKDVSSDLIVTASCDRGEVMALQHKEYPLYGVQFHPESILTESGHALLNNFLKVKIA